MSSATNEQSEKPALRPGVPDLGSLLLGYAVLGAQPVFVRLLSLAGLGFAESVIARFAFGGVLIIVACVWRGRWLRTEQPKMLLYRGIWGGIAVQLYFFSVQEAGAARATLLNYTYPLWANVFSLLFGQRIRPMFWALLAVASVGVGLLLVSPETSSPSLGLGELAGLASGLAAGASIITLKRLRDTDEELTILASFTVFGVLMSLPFVRFDAALPPVSPLVVLLLAGVGATSFFGHILFTRGYRSVPLPTASALALLVPTISTLLSAYWLQEPLSKDALWGAALVIGALGAVPFVAGTRDPSKDIGPDSDSSLREGRPVGDSGADGQP